MSLYYFLLILKLRFFYKNYFDYAYNKDVFKNHIFKKSTLRRKLKEYKD